MGACPKTEGVRPQAEGKSLRGIQHRSSGSGLVIRAVCLGGLPDGNRRFFLIPISLMALTKAEKLAQLKELKEKMQSSQSVIFTHYIGLTVADVSDLRHKRKEQNAEMKVAKKTLMQIAAKELNMPELSDESIQGAVACIFSFNDPLSGAQVAFKYSKDHPQVELIGGIYDGKLLSKQEALTLAKMPGRTQLLGMFMSMVQSPLRSFASVCNSPLQGFALALSEVAKKKA